MRVGVRVISCSILLAVSVGVVGCAASPKAVGGGASSVATSTPEATAAVEATTTTDSGPPPVVASGALHQPAQGSAERTALMDAARDRIKTSSQFVVHQLESDNAWAVGELAPSGGGATVFVSFRNEVDGGWQAIWNGAAGGPAGTTRADARFSPQVIAGIDWSGKPSTDDILAAAKKLAPLNGSAPVTGAKLNDITQDSKGRWWAAVIIENNVDGGVIVIYRDNGKWKCYAFGTGLEESDLPKDVKLSYY